MDVLNMKVPHRFKLKTVERYQNMHPAWEGQGEPPGSSSLKHLQLTSWQML